ncbi:MAG: hypothetical protein JO108_00215 [Acidobacteriaceae bacterium]|nr:hypothetical protein [Acidobacteriaceae bacterium]
MKRIMTSVLMAAGIAGPFVAHLGAQDNRTAADIPFAFVANQTVMSAGHYELVSIDASGSLFTLRNANGRGVLVTGGIRENGSPDRPHLTFACYGKECVLAKIAPPGSAIAYSLSERSVEKNLQHKLSVASMVSIKLAPR